MERRVLSVMHAETRLRAVAQIDALLRAERGGARSIVTVSGEVDGLEVSGNRGQNVPGALNITETGSARNVRVSGNDVSWDPTNDAFLADLTRMRDDLLQGRGPDSVGVEWGMDRIRTWGDAASRWIPAAVEAYRTLVGH